MKIFLFLALLAAGSQAVDHKIFHNCSEIAFCRELRTLPPRENYTPDLNSLRRLSDNYTVNIVLNSTDSKLNNLLLTVTHENKQFRIKINEINSNRYELPSFILNRKPGAERFDDIEVNKISASLSAKNYQLVITTTPFNIIIHEGRNIRAVLEGKELLLKNNGTSQIFSFGVLFPRTSRLYGIPAHADHLALRNTGVGGPDPYRLRNMDVPNHVTNSTMALYGTIPLLYAHGVNATTAVFLFNGAEQWVETQRNGSNNRAKWMVESGVLDLFVFLGSNPKEILEQYVNLTGRSLMPPLWALGYHQCRWNYDNQTDVLNVVRQMDEGNFPFDAIWLDIEYTDSKKYFTWDHKNFSDPIAMQKKINETGRKLVTIIDPHIKVDENYAVYKKAKDLNLYIKNPNGTNFEGDCWPGRSSWIDFLNPNASEYYGNQYQYENFPNTTPVLAGIWNDMNEPAVFDDTKEKTMPFDVLHYGNVEHRNVHNIYGFLHHRSTHGGLLKRDNYKKRPFILTRSYFAGSQRFTAVWTGDNTAGWDHLEVSYAQCLTLSISGVPFCGADIGGFSGEPELELLLRWYQAAIWLPFMREHANLNSKRREPYVHPQEARDNIRRSLQTRYKFIPLFYLKFYEHATTGSPVLTPLFYDYPNDTNAVDIDDQVLLGPVLAKVIAKPGVTNTTVYLPGDSDTIWFYDDVSRVYRGNKTYVVPVGKDFSPVFFKGGSVIPSSSAKKNTQGLLNSFNLEVYLDSNDEAYGRVYTDDGESFDYLHNRYSYVEFNCKMFHCEKQPIAGEANLLTDIINEIHFYSQNENGGITKVVKSYK